jgi:site-specific DNA recombinase
MNSESLQKDLFSVPSRRSVSHAGQNLLAVIYARTSSNSQRFGYSIREQVRRCWEFCDDAGWEVVFVFTDEAESGRNTERSEFQSMMNRAREGLFHVVVFWKLDRFCRSLADLVKTEEELDELGIGLHSVTEFLDTTNPVGRFNFRNLASAAELESDLVSQRVKLGMYGLARDLKWPNKHPPLGYQKKQDKRLVIDEEEQRIVKSIFNLYIKERSMPEVAFILNQKGLTTRQGGSWCRQSVAKILQNELYIGKYRVADFEKTVEEYRILPDEIFNEAVEVRYRFRNSHKPMNSERKHSKANRILTSYRSHLERGSR